MSTWQPAQGNQLIVKSRQEPLLALASFQADTGIRLSFHSDFVQNSADAKLALSHTTWVPKGHFFFSFHRKYEYNIWVFFLSSLQVGSAA
jgi:hypothetical protein